MPVEIEFRARFDERQRDHLVRRLTQDGTDLGRDDKHIFFYVLPDKLLKVTDNTTAGTAKITLKGSRIGQGSAFQETEFPIAREDVSAAVKLFDELGFGETMHDAVTIRRNFEFMGVEIAVKWSGVWGYHAEFEVLLPDGAEETERESAGSLIADVAAELGVTLMTEQELADFTAAFEAAEAQRKATKAPAAPH